MKKNELCEKIKELKSKGKTYNEIANELNCSKGTISYHLGLGQKEKTLNRQRKNRSKEHPFISKLRCFSYKKQRKISIIVSDWKQNVLYKKIWCFRNGGRNENMKTNFSVEDVLNKIGENPKCYLTGVEIDIFDTKSYEFDHIIPISRGGTNDLSNLGICSAKANRAKGNMTPDEFINLCRLVVSNTT